MRTKLPANINYAETFKLYDLLETIQARLADKLSRPLELWAVKQRRGYCTVSRNNIVITIPMWAIATKHPGYTEYYLCHELAHAYDLNKHNHGPEFMRWFKLICRPELWHYETSYKPRNAKAAGISENVRMNNITADDL